MRKVINYENSYIKLLETIMEDGYDHDDRTSIGRKSIQGYQMTIDMKKSFPMLSSKYVNFNNIKYELFWFLGYHMNLPEYKSLNLTNIKYLVDNNVNIWNEWPHQNYLKQTGNFISLKTFKDNIKEDFDFANKWGNLGNVYGKQWLNWNGTNQIEKVIASIKNNPFSSRHIVSAWNVDELGDMLLPPCHNMFQFLVNDQNELSCIFNMRSTDVFLGLPYNIASYALLLEIIAKHCGMGVNLLIYNGGDVHIYHNHYDAIKQQLSNYNNLNNTLTPQLILPNYENINDINISEIFIQNYTHSGVIKAPVAV